MDGVTIRRGPPGPGVPRAAPFPSTTQIQPCAHGCSCMGRPPRPPYLRRPPLPFSPDPPLGPSSPPAGSPPGRPGPSRSRNAWARCVEWETSARPLFLFFAAALSLLQGRGARVRTAAGRRSWERAGVAAPDARSGCVEWSVEFVGVGLTSDERKRVRRGEGASESVDRASPGPRSIFFIRPAFSSTPLTFRAPSWSAPAARPPPCWPT